MTPAHGDELHAIPVDDGVRAGAGRVVEPPVDPQLELLPTNLMDWEDFERLLLDLGRDVLGLRSLSYFGKRGQAQMGLDVVGTNADGKPEGIQSKRYKEFSVADLDAAVEKYTQSTLPFKLVRFAIGVASRVDDRKVGERKVVLNEVHHPLEIDIWDQSRVSEMLRDKPDLVIKYFSALAAERFCVPHALIPVEVTGPDAVATSDAVRLGPLKTADAQGHLDRAREIAADDPAGALDLYLDVQDRLRESGFPGHAAEFDDTVASLSIRAGKERAALRLLMDALWAAESANDSVRADRAAHTLRKLAGFPRHGRPTQDPRSPALGAAVQIADFVSGHLHEPVPATRIDLPVIASSDADAVDRARVVLFASEYAHGDDDLGWIAAHQEQITTVADEVAQTAVDLSVRLRLVLADSTGDWTDLIHSARTRMRRDLRALTLARHARYEALKGRFPEADAQWYEAISDACLAQRHDEGDCCIQR